MKFPAALAALIALAMLAFAGSATASVGLNAYKVDAGASSSGSRSARASTSRGHRRGGIEIVATKGQVSSCAARASRPSCCVIGADAPPGAPRLLRRPGGWQVRRPYARTDVELSGAAGNPTDNFVTQLKKIAKRYDKITELVTLGRTLNDVPIYALRITKNADRTRTAPPGGALLGDSARTRVARRRDEPAHAADVRRQLRRARHRGRHRWSADRGCLGT